MKLLVFIAKGFETIDEISVDDYDALAIPGGFEEFGATIVQTPIVVDENIITSYGPQTSYGVALLLLEKLTSHQEMVLVKEAMGF